MANGVSTTRQTEQQLFPVISPQEAQLASLAQAQNFLAVAPFLPPQIQQSLIQQFQQQALTGPFDLQIQDLDSQIESLKRQANDLLASTVSKKKSERNALAAQADVLSRQAAELETRKQQLVAERQKRLSTGQPSPTPFDLRLPQQKLLDLIPPESLLNIGIPPETQQLLDDLFSPQFGRGFGQTVQTALNLGVDPFTLQQGGASPFHIATGQLGAGVKEARARAALDVGQFLQQQRQRLFETGLANVEAARQFAAQPPELRRLTAIRGAQPFVTQINQAFAPKPSSFDPIAAGQLIGMGLGALGGAFVGGPSGALVGSQIGGQIGGAAGGVFGGGGSTPPFHPIPFPVQPPPQPRRFQTQLQQSPFGPFVVNVPF